MQSLISQGIGPNHYSFSSIGYREIHEHLESKLTLDQVKTEIIRKTKNLVRHQYNWFKLSDPNITWYDLSTTKKENQIIDEIAETIK